MSNTTRVTLFRRGQYWYLNYWLNGKRVKEATGLTSKTAAEKLRVDREKSLVTGKVHHLVQQKIAVSRCYKHYLRECEASYLSHKTIATSRSSLKKLFRWAQLATVDQFTTAKLTDFFTYRVKVDKLIASSQRRNREALSAFFSYVKRMGYIETNPVSELKSVKIPEPEIRYLKLGQIEGCLKAVQGDRLEPLIVCAIFSGLRRGEICWLTWEDVDLTEGKPLLHVRKKMDGKLEWKPKTGKKRAVPIHSRLLPYLNEAKLRAGNNRWVFLSPESCRWDPDNLGHKVADLMASVRLDWGFLEFRHTYGSQLAIKGVSLLKIAKLMGNSFRIAERHYASLQTEDLHDDIEFGSATDQSKSSSRGERRVDRST